MAVVQNPVTGRSKQKYASAIFSTWKGINVLRSLPLTVANPKTPGQLLQRAKLSITVALYRLMPGVVKIGYRQQAVKKSEYNAFASDTLKNAFTGSTAETVEIDLTKLSVSKGTMAPTPTTLVVMNGDTMEIGWDETAPLAPGQAATDQANAVVIAKDQTSGLPVVLGTASNVARSVGQIDVLNVDQTGMEETTVYLYFASTVGNQVSDSVYETPA